MEPKDNTSSPSRRTILGGMSAGVIAAAALPGTSPASAQPAGATTAAGPPQAAKQNPLTQYPKPHRR
jgi:hypothetical protein